MNAPNSLSSDYTSFFVRFTFISFLALLVFLVFLVGFLSFIPPSAQAFTLDGQFMPAEDIIPGTTGFMLTVKHAKHIAHIPVEVVSTSPLKMPENDSFILIRLIGEKLAQGMSGSPVYIREKLIGAVRSGWENSGHQIALVTPIAQMIQGADNLKHKLCVSDLTIMQLSGLSSENSSIIELSGTLRHTITSGIRGLGYEIRETERLKPGSSISVYLVWGDAELSALGTVTAVDKAGNFLAFGHEFLKRGTVNFPCGGAYIHDIVNSEVFPLKLSSSEGINGTVMSDTDSGIGGTFGKYAPSIPCEVELHNMDTGEKNHYTFRTITDEYISSELIASISRGLCEDGYGRRGEGTMSIRLHIDSRNLPSGWTHRNIYYSDTDIITEGFKDVKEILTSCFLQPYEKIFPCGISIKVQVTNNPRVLLIEDVSAPSSAKPGESIDITVKLREYRKPAITRKITLKIPDDAHGVIELIVRGGGTQSFKQAGISGGWKSITGLENMLAELKAMDTNNQLIIELNIDHTGNFLNSLKSGKNPPAEPDLLPEEQEYLSETKQRRIHEGTLKILDSEYYIDGLMRRIIHTEG